MEAMMNAFLLGCAVGFMAGMLFAIKVLSDKYEKLLSITVDEYIKQIRKRANKPDSNTCQFCGGTSISSAIGCKDGVNIMTAICRDCGTKWQIPLKG
jgi:hypothetical protein